MSTTYAIQVVTHSVHVRSTPEYKANGSNVVGYIQNGQKFTATKYQNGWYYIPSKKGWSKSSSGGDTYIKVLKTNKVAEKTTTPAIKKEVEKEKKTTTKTTTTTKKTTEKKVDAGLEYNYLTQALSKVNTLDMSGTFDNNVATFKKASVVSTASYDTSDGLVFRSSTTGAAYSSSKAYSESVAGTVKLASVGRSDYAVQASDYDDIEESLASIRRNLNIFKVSDRSRLFNEFNRYKIAMPDYHATKLIPYIFFTKPELALVDTKGELSDQLLGDPLWESLYSDNPKLFTGLDADYGGDHTFNAFLSNTARSFQASDEVLKTVDHGETYTGWKMVYGRNTNESNTAGQFSISYIDNHNFDIYKMHKIWIEYINRVYRGEMAIRREYIFKKVLTYPCSLYYIVCAADGETVLYWTKYFGVFPINTPASVSSWTHGSHHGLPEFSVNYVYALKEDFHPISLNEFNRQSSGDLIYSSIYDPEILTNSPSLVGAPYIDSSKDSGRQVYKLRFRK